jgi:hypothetical protein
MFKGPITLITQINAGNDKIKPVLLHNYASPICENARLNVKYVIENLWSEENLLSKDLITDAINNIVKFDFNSDSDNLVLLLDNIRNHYRHSKFEENTLLSNKGEFGPWCKTEEYAASIAASLGDLNKLKLIFDWFGNNIEIKSPYCSVLDYSVKSGNIEVVKYLVEEKGAKTNDYTVSNAVEKGFYNIADYLIVNGAKVSDVNIFVLPPHTVDYEGAEYLYKKGAKTDKFITKDLIQQRNIKTIKFLLKHDPDIAAINSKYAAEEGQIEVVKLFVDNGAPISDFIQYVLIREGSIDNIKFLRDHGANK